MGMHIEEIFELRGPELLGRIYTPITSCFHDKAKISKETIRLDCYLLLKYYRRQYTLLPLTWSNRLQNLILKCKILNLFWT